MRSIIKRLLLSLLLLPLPLCAQMQMDSINARGNVSVGGSLSAKQLEGCQQVDGVAYARTDIGVQQAINDAGGNGCIYLAAGSYTFSNSVNFVSGQHLQCAGRSSTILNWTGSTSGAEFVVNGLTGVTIRDCGFTTSNSGRAIDALAVSDMHIMDNKFSPGFSGDIHITGDGTSANSGEVFIVNNKGDGYTSYGVSLDHVIEVHLDRNHFYGATNNTSVHPLIVDTGSSGINSHDFEAGYAGQGIIFRNTNQGGAYGAAPTFLFFDQMIPDTCTGGDCVIFDASLGSASIYAYFTNSWAAFAGMNDLGQVITAAGNGWHISGGRDITIDTSKARVNANNGILIDNSNVQWVKIVASTIVGNNLANGADGNGIYVTASVPHVAIIGNYITNSIGGDAGHQLYGIKLAVAQSFISIVGNDINGNLSGNISNPLGGADVAGNAIQDVEISNIKCIKYDHAGSTSLCPVSSSGAFTLNVPAANGTLGTVIASGTAAMTTAAITAGNCGSTVTVAAAGVLTTDTITWAVNAAPAGTNAGLIAWPTSGNVNFAYCGIAETPVAATINWKVVR